MIYDDVCSDFHQKQGKSQISQEPAIQVLKKNVCPQQCMKDHSKLSKLYGFGKRTMPAFFHYLKKISKFWEHHNLEANVNKISISPPYAYKKKKIPNYIYIYGKKKFLIGGINGKVVKKRTFFHQR